MRKGFMIWTGLVLVLILGLAACNFGGESGPLTLEEAIQAGVQATLTKEAWLDGVESARKTAIAEENNPGGEGGENALATATPTLRPTREPTPMATLKPASVHLMFPGEMSDRVDTFLVDYNTIDYADEGVTYGDQFRGNIFERPFTSEEMIYYGYWFSPERTALQGMMDEIQKGVTGTVRVKLYKGSCAIAGRKSPYSLYHPQLATFEQEDVYNQKDAEGFIKLNALRLKLRTFTRQKGKKSSNG